MQLPKDANEYFRMFADELGERILHSYPPLHAVEDVPSVLLGQLLRKPFPAQTLAIMGVVKRWGEARAAGVIAECGTGKTLISLAAAHVHSGGRPFTALAMVPRQLVEKWAREAFRTLPRIRVFFVDGLRTQTSSTGHAGVNEVRLRNGRIVREGLRTTLTELRLRKTSRTARQRWDCICGSPALFMVGRDRGARLAAGQGVADRSRRVLHPKLLHPASRDPFFLYPGVVPVAVACDLFFPARLLSFSKKDSHRQRTLTAGVALSYFHSEPATAGRSEALRMTPFCPLRVFSASARREEFGLVPFRLFLPGWRGNYPSSIAGTWRGVGRGREAHRAPGEAIQP